VLRKSSHSTHFSHVFLIEDHFVLLFYSGYEPKFIKHITPDYDCFACEAMFWQCSTVSYVKSCFKAIF